jgi:hypothetical protein
MSPTLIAVLILGALIIVVIAFALYKAGFRPTEITVKTGPVEAKMKRTLAQSGESEAATSAKPATPIQFSQEAINSSEIRKSSIKAPADSSASASQKAEDDSRLDDAHIKLT